MGLFSKHKKEELKPTPAPAAPPLPSVASVQNAAPVDNLAGSTLTPPQIPSGNLEDIKSQVSTQDVTPVAPVVESDFKPEVVADNSKDLFSSDNLSLGNDELFDFSDSNESSKSVLDEGSSKLETTMDFDSNVVDTKGESNSSLNFISRGSSLKSSNNSSIFLTTSEFKTLLEIIEAVKARIKNSSDTHLRLLDIKSEEDIEFENLRKDFQFVEDKLYELDTLIFDK